jgi:hypothetical protein
MDGSITDRYAFADLMANPRIVIIGAGFVGLPTARKLKKRLPSADVFLVDKKDHFLFTPRLIDLLETPSDKYTPRIAPIAARQKFTFVQGEARNIDRTKKIVYVKTTRRGSSRTWLRRSRSLPRRQNNLLSKPQAQKPTRSRSKFAKTSTESMHASKNALPMQKTRIRCAQKRSSRFSWLVLGRLESKRSSRSKPTQNDMPIEHAPTLKQYLSFAVLQAAPTDSPRIHPRSCERHEGRALSSQYRYF